MAIDFPNSPTVGDTYITNGKQYRWDGTVWGIYGTFAPDSTASDTEPTGVGDGHIWYRSDQSQTLIRYDNTWVEVGSAGGFNSSSTSFPTSLDSGTGFAAVEALQAKVGADSSAVTSSLDYKVAQLEAEPSANEIAIFNETQSSGTQGGAGTSGSYAKRTLNTTVANNISGCSIASSVITLPAGTYQVMAYSPTYRIDRGKSRLYDTTNSAVLAIGGTGLASAGGYGTFISVIATQFTLAGSTNIELQTQVQFSTGTQDLGLAAGFGDDEIYSQIIIRRIA